MYLSILFIHTFLIKFKKIIKQITNIDFTVNINWNIRLHCIHCINQKQNLNGINCDKCDKLIITIRILCVIKDILHHFDFIK